MNLGQLLQGALTFLGDMRPGVNQAMQMYQYDKERKAQEEYKNAMIDEMRNVAMYRQKEFEQKERAEKITMGAKAAYGMAKMGLSPDEVRKNYSAMGFSGDQLEYMMGNYFEVADLVKNQQDDRARLRIEFISKYGISPDDPGADAKAVNIFNETDRRLREAHDMNMAALDLNNQKVRQDLEQGGKAFDLSQAIKTTQLVSTALDNLQKLGFIRLNTITDDLTGSTMQEYQLLPGSDEYLAKVFPQLYPLFQNSIEERENKKVLNATSLYYQLGLDKPPEEGELELPNGSQKSDEKEFSDAIRIMSPPVVKSYSGKNRDIGIDIQNVLEFLKKNNYDPEFMIKDIFNKNFTK